MKTRVMTIVFSWGVRQPVLKAETRLNGRDVSNMVEKRLPATDARVLIHAIALR